MRAPTLAKLLGLKALTNAATAPRLQVPTPFITLVAYSVLPITTFVVFAVKNFNAPFDAAYRRAGFAIAVNIPVPFTNTSATLTFSYVILVARKRVFI